MGGGQDITNQRVLDLEQMGEEQVFNGYLEHQTLRAFLNSLWTPRNDEHGNPGKEVSSNPFYKWIDREPGRRARWDEVKRRRGSMMVEEAHDIAMGATPETAKVAKIQIDTKQWAAAHYNKQEFGREQVTEQAIGTVLMAMAKALDAKQLPDPTADESRVLQAEWAEEQGEQEPGGV